MTAQRWARAWNVPYVERRVQSSLETLLEERADALLVFGEKSPVLWDSQGRLPFHAGMAELRLQRIDSGDRDDALVRVGHMKAGETVFDATLGLAQDARVAARLVGPTGRVLGMERSLPLFALAASGLAEVSAPGSCAVEVEHGDAAERLAQLPDSSFDCVMFDPMFEREKRAQPGFELLRRHAARDGVSPESLAHATRVARRCVLVKAARYTSTFERLGLAPEWASSRASVVWARIDVRTRGAQAHDAKTVPEFRAPRAPRATPSPPLPRAS